MFNKIKIILNVYFLLLCVGSFSFFSVSARDLPDFSALVEKNSAAVVNISTRSKINNSKEPHLQYGFPGVPKNSPFNGFLEKYFGEIPESAPLSKEHSSLGSGFIVSEDGYVITNHHVIKNANEIIVRLNDRREFFAKLIGSDERSDIALLKIDVTGLPILSLGDSSDLKVGEWVLAIGSPFGFDHSVTAGIISAIGRNLPSDNYIPFIQTDVAINPGNSGGPLFDLDGKVIGVNSQIYSRTGGFMGLSFAVPIDVVNNVYKQLKNKGHVSRAWLGVYIQDVTKELAESFGMEHPHGALVSKVSPNSPAENAGIEVGDIITNFDGHEISYSSELPPLVGNKAIDEKVSVKVIRESKAKKIVVKLSELVSDNKIAENKEPLQENTVNILNMTVQNLTKAQSKKIFGTDKKQGVLVTGLGEGAAKRAGIHIGDVLLMINNVKIKEIEHFNKTLKLLPKNKSLPVLVQRQGSPIFFALKIQ